MVDCEKRPDGALAAPRGQRRSIGTLMRAFGVACLLGMCAGVFWQWHRTVAAPPVKTGKVRMACELRASAIVRAIQVYAMEHGRFPPAYIADKDGKPMHSWRVLIWPYLEKNKAFRQYRWDEPWNSENNQTLAKEMPRALRCPHDFESAPGETSYLLLAGPGTWFDNGVSPPVEQLSHPEKTMVLIEAAGEKVHWMEPRDLDISQLAAGATIRSFHRTGKTCGFADGSIEVLKDEATVADLLPFVRKDAWTYHEAVRLPVAAP